MAYYTGVYKKDDFYQQCELVWKNDQFRVYSWGGRLFLYTVDFYRISQLIEGFTSLEKYHKGSYETWIESVRKKDSEKVRIMREYRVELEHDINLIQNIWK